jgi:nucleoside-diphosphate-sugar epimerase
MKTMTDYANFAKITKKWMKTKTSESLRIIRTIRARTSPYFILSALVHLVWGDRTVRSRENSDTTRDILVTGGAGALGSSLTSMLLARGHRVTVIDRLQQNCAWRLRKVAHNEGLSYIWKAVEDMTLKDIDGIGTMIYCNAQADRPLGISSPRYTVFNNILPLVHVLELVKDSESLHKFLLPSSGTIFLGVSNSELPVDEDTIPKPANPYSASKYMEEIVCQSYARAYGVPVVILRSGLVYGHGMRLDISIAQFIMKALTNDPIYVRSPKTTRTPAHIDDVLKFWDRIAEADHSEIVGRTIHTVPGVEYSMVTIAETIKNVLGSSSAIVLGEYEPGELINGLPAREWTISKTASELGVVCDVSLEEGIMRTVPYIREATAHPELISEALSPEFSLSSVS